MENERKENAEYTADIKKYFDAPVSLCTKEQSLKLLKRFSKKSFSAFWTDHVNEYLPAVSEGTMKLAEKKYSHEDAIKYAKSLIHALDPKELAKAFLYGVAHNSPEYRTALACYYYIKNLPEHEFEKCLIGSTAAGDIYSDHICEICGYDSKLSEEPKMQFWHINIDMANFYLTACIPFCFTLSTVILFLEEYKKLPEPPASVNDFKLFEQTIAFIEALLENTSPSKLRKELKQSGLLKMTTEQINAFIDMLGYLNILHTRNDFGVTACHTKERDMPGPLSDRSYFAHPVNRWTRKDGIDYDTIRHLFGNLF